MKFLIFPLIFLSMLSNAQVLSNLQGTRKDALFTTYAAPPERSHYRTDQGYRLRWNDAEAGVELVSKEGPCLGLAFQQGERVIFRLNELFREPVVTVSYSDLVRFNYYPLKDLRVEIFFDVYSSETAIMRVRMVNEGRFPLKFTLLPYFYFGSADSINDIDHSSDPDGYRFRLLKPRDGWMKEHAIPLAETLTGCWTLTGSHSSSALSFVRGRKQAESGPLEELIRSFEVNRPFVKGVVRTRNYILGPGDATGLSIQLTMDIPERWRQTFIKDRSGNSDPVSLIRADERAYSRIPELKGLTHDETLFYYSCFTLMRQCMMPPEGKCGRNYYVFSREPRWGWGYGGQVFHESLAMPAYAYMDPEGSMNSQRIFMDRQDADGYINYRTGPWLDERIVTNGQPTSSAPWYSYENLEVYNVTRDRRFLAEAYASGTRFYRYYTAIRDTNRNGLCEWGAHAELESVRDAKVALWDQVGWPSNFEGPDVNSMLVMEAKSLALMADLLGKKSEAEAWQKDAMARTGLINRYLWDSVTRFYYNVNRADRSFTFRKNNDLKRKEIIGFLPLWAGVADKGQAAALMLSLKDSDQFWRPNGVPSLSASDDYYCPIGYWNGPVWVPWNYLIYLGLKDYGYQKEAGELAGKVTQSMIYHLKNDHTFWEFYSADDRQAGWNKTYIWAGIAARFLIDEHEPVKKPVR